MRLHDHVGFIANGAANYLRRRRIETAGVTSSTVSPDKQHCPGTLPVSVALERSTINGRVQLSGNRLPDRGCIRHIAGALFAKTMRAIC